MQRDLSVASAARSAVVNLAAFDVEAQELTTSASVCGGRDSDHAIAQAAGMGSADSQRPDRSTTRLRSSPLPFTMRPTRNTKHTAG